MNLIIARRRNIQAMTEEWNFLFVLDNRNITV